MKTLKIIFPIFLCLCMIALPQLHVVGAAQTIQLGDVNADGKINSSDARLTLRTAAKLPVTDTFLAEYADINGDGKINSSDARQILCYAARIITNITDKPTTTTRPTTTVPQTKDPMSYKIAMLGDSLVATLAGYEVNSKRIDYYGKVNLNVYTIFNKKASGSDRYIIDEVSGRNYDKIIIHLGVNEVDYDNTVWGNQYAKVIDAVRSRAPGAEIYCDAILPISAAASARNEFGCNNNAINRKNEIIRRVAEEKGVHFVDAGVLLRNENGVLPAGAASDGIHLNYNYCITWTNWLLNEICK